MPFSRRLGLCFAHIDSTADVHPTAVIEGSVVESDARVGAHAVVRYSHVGRGARLFDGVTVEHSVVGPRSWLMHGLALYRSHVEDEAFLIHGPYQFSCFQSGSAAFATIMMDYRPDARPIRAETVDGIREYRGRFLGALLQEKSKALGGCLLTPGLTVPAGTWLACDPASLHRPTHTEMPQGVPVPPREITSREPVEVIR